MKYEIKIAQITDKETIKNLLQPYLTELSVFPDEDPDYKDKNGTYLYPYLNAYWIENERFPYLLYSDGRLAGFALIQQDVDHWEIAEYYVVPEFRRHGLGETCATDIFKRHPGMWKIWFNKHNQPSRALWHKLSRILAHGDIEEGELDINHDYIRFVV